MLGSCRSFLHHLDWCGSLNWRRLLVTLFDLCLFDRFTIRWEPAARGINLDIPEVELAEETIHECALLCARASPSTPPASSRSTRTTFRHPPVFASTSNSTALRTASPPSADCR